MIYTYTDAFLATRMTLAVETRAIADVADLGTLPATWVARLGVLRAYIVLCMELMTGQQDDAFGAKLAAYRKEWGDMLTQARAAQAALDAAAGTTTGGASVFTINLERC